MLFNKILSFNFALLVSTSVVDGRRSFPLFNQQCDHDEGPRFEDDLDTFGENKKYHFGSPATPVLKDGKCADPLQAACGMRGNPKLAYMEGPINCGGNGFYCTVVEQEGWDPRELLDNLNFGYCNKTEAFDSTDFQEDGHCHGSDDDSAYYWVLRDHWFRYYNGRMRCCCNWEEGNPSLFDGKFTNRCDYRTKIEEGLGGECENANRAEFNFEEGCDVEVEDNQLGNPVPENDDLCWEITSFGEPLESTEDVCDDDPNFTFKGRRGRDCTWIGLRPEIRCGKEVNGVEVSEYCPKTCGICNDSDDGDDGDDDDDDVEAVDGCVNDLEFRFRNNRQFNCGWVGQKPGKRCNRVWDGEPLSAYCPESCGLCDD